MIKKVGESCSIFYNACVFLNLESSTGVVESMTYAGIVYYEERGVEDLVTFTAAKNLNALLEVIVIMH